MKTPKPRQEAVNIRYSVAEYSQVKSDAACFAMAISTYLRALSLGHIKLPRKEKVDGR